MKRFLSLLAAGLLVLVALVPAGAVDARTGLDVDLAVSAIPSTLVKGDRFDLTVATCVAQPGAAVSIERRTLPNGSWAAVRNTTLSASGTVSISLRPNSLRSFGFRVVMPGRNVQASPEQVVTVVAPTRSRKGVGTVAARTPVLPPFQMSTMPSSVPKGTSFPMSFATCPAQKGAPVTVERRTSPDGRWSTVRRGTLDSAGAASFSIRPNSYTTFDFRVRAAGSSPVLTPPQTVAVSGSAPAPKPAPKPAPPAPPPKPVQPEPAPQKQAVSVSGVPSTLVTGGNFDMTVTTSPKASRAQIVVQKRVEDGDWFDVRTTRLDADGAKTVNLYPVAVRSYGFRVVLKTDPPVTSNAQTVRVVRDPTKSTGRIDRYQLFDDRSIQWIPRGQWVDLQAYQTRDNVPTLSIIQLNMNIRDSIGGRPTYLLVGWRTGDGRQVGVQTRTLPVKSGDRPFQISHSYTWLAEGTTTAQIFVPGSGRTKITTEIVKAIAHPAP